MRILIIGAGNTGRQLAAKLCDERHDVVMVDSRQAPLDEIAAQYDILTVTGSGSDPRILETAEMRKSDLVVAVTNSDETNLLVGIYAHAAGVANTVARVSNEAMIHSDAPYNPKSLGIDLVVSRKAEAARELFNVLRLPGTQEVVDMLNGRVMVVGIKVHTDSPLITAPLASFPRPELLEKIRFIAAVRGEQLLTPEGDTQFMIGDDVYVVGRPKAVADFVGWAQPEHQQFQKVVISGGGDLGYNLARMCETTSMKVVLVEMDEEQARHCSSLLDRALVIHGDALDQEILEEDARIDSKTAFVAATGDDENNIISCLLAEKVGASFTIAQITKPEYVPIINASSLLDRAVSPHLAMINAILRFVRGTHVHSAAQLYNLPGELLEVALPPDSPWAGTYVRDVDLPEGTIIATVLRDEAVVVPTGDLQLLGEDRLVMFAKPKSVKKVESFFQNR